MTHNNEQEPIGTDCQCEIGSTEHYHPDCPDTPKPEHTQEVESWKIKFDEVFSLTEDLVSGGAIINKLDFKEALYGLMEDVLSQHNKDIWSKLKNYDFKEKHICRFNDGKQDCDCFIAGLNVALELLTPKE